MIQFKSVWKTPAKNSHILQILLDHLKARNDIWPHILHVTYTNIVHIIEMFVNCVHFPYESGPKSWLNCNEQDRKNSYLSVSQHPHITKKQDSQVSKQTALWHSHAFSITHRDLILKYLLLKDNSMDSPGKLMSLDLPKSTKMTWQCSNSHFII